jgi:glycosyltransferase involved in cell wall biosynthesis
MLLRSAQQVSTRGNPRRVRVLYVVTAYDRYGGEGITPWLVETIRRLKAAGVDVEVLAPSYRGLPDAEVAGVMVHRFRYAPAAFETLTHDQTAPDRIRERPWLVGLLPGYLLSGGRAARNLARTGRFDVVHVHWPLPHAMLGLAAKRAAGLPLVSTFHGVEIAWARRQLPFMLPWLRRWIRQSDAVTANSSYTAALVRQVYDRPVDRIPFGATVPVPTTGMAAPRTAGDPFQLLFVGRLVERKGIQHLLPALASLRARYAVRLHLVGTGPMEGPLRAQAQRLELGDVVQFHGFIDTTSLSRRYAGAHAFVLPAVQDRKGDVEGLGVVLIEAGAYGLPLVASRAGGIVDVVREGETGLLVPPGDEQALEAALERLILHPGLARRLGDGARAHVEAEFSWPAITQRLLALYRHVTAPDTVDAAADPGAHG